MKYVIVLTSLVVSGVIGLAFVLQISETEEIGKWKVLHQSEFIHGSHLSRVMFFDKENGIVVSPGAIAKTNDGGKNWAYAESSEKNGYYSFAFADKQNGIAVGSIKNEIPLVLRTGDAGGSWQPLSFDPTPLNSADIKISTLLDVCFDSTGNIWIVGNKGIVNATGDDNKLNIKVVYSTAEEMFSVACAENGQVWAVGGGTVLVNEGSGWQKKQLDPKYRFGKIKSIGSEIWLLGGIQSEPDSALNSGIVLRSNNFGQTWENKTPKAGRLQHDIVRQDGVLWLVGESGQIHFSKDGGETWIKSPSPSTSDLLSIYFLDSRSGWITGERGTILSYGR